MGVLRWTGATVRRWVEVRQNHEVGTVAAVAALYFCGLVAVVVADVVRQGRG